MVAIVEPNEYLLVAYDKALIIHTLWKFLSELHSCYDVQSGTSSQIQTLRVQ
jgi:hypothetical protein